MPLAPSSVPVFEGSRLRMVEQSPAPLPRSSGVTAGFTVEPMAHGMAQLIDPRGAPCGVFASETLAPATLAFLSR